MDLVLCHAVTNDPYTTSTSSNRYLYLGVLATSTR